MLKLVKVVFTWIEGKTKIEVAESPADDNSAVDVPDQGEKHICSRQHSKLGSRNCAESNDGQIHRHPIDDILHWHNAIRKDLHDIAEETRRVQQSGDLSDISAFNERLQFIADVCIYHRCVCFGVNFLVFLQTLDRVGNMVAITWASRWT